MTNSRSSSRSLDPGSPAEQTLADLIASITAVDLGAADDARNHDARLTKPPGSLGQIEEVAFRLAAVAGSAGPSLVEPGAVLVFAADHGVHVEGVSPWPQEVTAQMVANFCAGGAAINAIGRANGLEVRVVNVGVASPVPDHPGLINRPVRFGTANLRREPAMTRPQAAQAMLIGAETAMALVAGGTRCLITGDMGIANTTPSAAVVAAIAGRSAGDVTGRGTGIDDAMLGHKVSVVADALARIGSGRAGAVPLDPLGVLSEVGGLEIAAIGGLCLAGAAARVPVIVDGVIALAGALVACAMAPAVAGYLLAGHRSVEPAAIIALDHLGLDPLLDLGLRLGEGTGAALAYPLVRAAVRLQIEMATFDSAGVTTAQADPGDG